MTVRIIAGDCREGLRALAAGSVHCAITSPPYYGLRDYKIEPTVWGGDPKCEHEWNNNDRMIRHTGGKGKSTLQNDGRRDAVRILNQARKVDASSVTVSQGTFCHCGAWRGAFGLEPDWRMYIDHAVDVFREVRRVLRDDGTLWLNIGDSYATGGGASPTQQNGAGAGHRGARLQVGDTKNPRANIPTWGPNRAPQQGFKPKDRMMMPARVAIALCDDGWWLRDEIIWRKPNPMPSSVEDRTTPAHEMVYLLTKRARYFYDNEAIKEPTLSLDPTHPSFRPNSAQIALDGRKEFSAKHEMSARSYDPAGRNKRSVWDVTTEPFPEAHFATFPTSLVEPMIKAGTSERGCCPRCQGPWERIRTKQFIPQIDVSADRTIRTDLDESSRWEGSVRGSVASTTLGWQPTCKCEGAAAMATIPAVVLDPFGGAGTVGLVADRLQRDAVLLELNPGYAEMARRRIDGDAPLFATKEAAE